MSPSKTMPRSAASIRWIARIWSILVFAVALLEILTPDPNATEPVPVADWLLLGLWGVAILGLLVAWRWELAGGMITIATMLVREMAWVILKGHWHANILIVWVFVVPPAILFLVAWGLGKRAKEA